jgi:excisionase family DNA binding protein
MPPKTTPPPETALTVHDVATSLHLSANTVRGMVADGTLRGYRIGRQWRIDREDFEAWKFTAKRRAERTYGDAL